MRARFHVVRHVRDIRKHGLHAIRRKIGRLPEFVKRTRLASVIRSAVLAMKVLVRLTSNTIKGISDYGKVAESLEFLHSDLVFAASDDGSKLARKIKALLAQGQISEALRCSESVSLEDPVELLNQVAQVNYLNGAWATSVDIRRKVIEKFDNQVSKSWLRHVNLRFISGSFIGHIGHLGLIDLLCKAKDLDLLSNERRMFVGVKDSVANLDYLMCWKNQIEIDLIEREEFRSFTKQFHPLFDDVTIVRLKDSRPDFYSAYSRINELWTASGRGPLITPDESSIAESRAYFANFGLDPDGWFVGIHVRGEDPHWWTNATDSDVNDYLPAIDRIIAAGGYVIRIGDSTMKPLPIRKGLIDYAHAPNRKKSHDVYVWSKCRFFIGTGSGPMNIPHTFGRPTLYSNCPALGLDQQFNKFMTMPKLLRRRSTAELVRLEDVMKSPYAWSVSRRHDGYDYEYVENSPEVLIDATEEMMSQTTDEQYSFETSDEQEVVSNCLFELGRTGRSPLPQSFLSRYESLWK